jgi:uncharacterized membrane protein YgcG
MAAVLATSVGASASYSSRKPTASPTTEAEAEAVVVVAEEEEPQRLLGVIPRHMGLVDVPAALSIIVFSTMFAVVGARVSRRLHEQSVRKAQGILMMAIAPSLLLSDHLKTTTTTVSSVSSVSTNSSSSGSSSSSSSSSSGGSSSSGISSSSSSSSSGKLEQNLNSFYEFVTCPVTQRLACIGSVSGLAAGFFGVGGGAVTVPALVYCLDFDYRTALATSLVGT